MNVGRFANVGLYSFCCDSYSFGKIHDGISRIYLTIKNNSNYMTDKLSGLDKIRTVIIPPSHRAVLSKTQLLNSLIN